jgi:hypothetical protein
MKLTNGLTAVIFLPIFLIAQTPKITSITPSKVYTQSEPTVVHVTIKGDEMWPDYMTVTLADQIMHTHFKKVGRDEEVSRVEMSSFEHKMQFTSPGWLDSPGNIEVYITIDAYNGRPAVRSNSVFLQVTDVPKTAPVISNISKNSFKLGEAKDKYKFRIYGSNFGEQHGTYPMVNGIKAGVSFWNLEDGVIDVWIPKEVYSTVGEYPVVVHTNFGESNAVMMKIEKSIMLNVARAGMTKNTKPATTPATQTSIATVNRQAVIANTDPRVSVLVRGISVDMVGVIGDGGTGAMLESYIRDLPGVMIVQNHLTVADSAGNINITVKGEGVDAATLENIRNQIRARASELKLNVAVG